MTMNGTARWQQVGIVLVTVAALAGCTGSPGSGASPFAAAPAAAGAPGSAAPTSERTPAPSPPPDAFTGLPYRLELPSTWIALGSDAYDKRLDATPDVKTWLAGLGLDGQNAFRAYEPSSGGIGFRLAVNPQRTWNPSPLQEEGSVAALPGVTGKVSSDVVVSSDTWKAFGYRWTETMDWGSGSPSARDCIGYFVMVDPNPVNVVMCYPTGSDRRAEADAIAATFEMTGTPVFSLPPGETATPSPTPFDKNATPPPSIAPHAAPELEALLPDKLGGREVTKESQTGVGMGTTDADPLLAPFGKHPSDLTLAQGSVMPGNGQPAALLGVERVAGVPGAQLLAAILGTMPDAKVSQVTLGGRQVTLVEYGAWPVWMYAASDGVYSVGLAGETAAAEFFARLP